MAEKLGVDETIDLIDYASALVDKLGEAKEDDGKIDKAEIIGALASTAPAAVKAFFGVDEVSDELKDLDPEETKKLLSLSMPVLIKFIKLFQPT